MQKTPWFIPGPLRESAPTVRLQSQALNLLQSYPWATNLQDSLQTIQKQLVTIPWSIIPWLLKTQTAK